MIDLQELPRVIEDLRKHTPEQLAELRLLLNAGCWNDQTPAALVSLKSMGRPMSTTYFGTPFAAKFCSWPPGTVKKRTRGRIRGVHINRSPRNCC